MKFKLDEALHGFDEIDEYNKLTKEIGLKNLGDIRRFKKEVGGAELKDLKKVRDELGPNFKIKESKKCNVDLDEALGLKEYYDPTEEITDYFSKEEQEEYGIDEEGYTEDGLEQYVHCGWCEEPTPLSDMRKELNLGYICKDCQDALYSRGEKAVYEESLKESIDENTFILEIGYANNNGFFDKKRKKFRTEEEAKKVFDSKAEQLINEIVKNNELNKEEETEYREAVEDSETCFEAFNHVWYLKDPEDEWYILIDQMFDNELDKSLKEDTIKQNGKWVNKGKEGTHGTFRTKKAADTQRKAMFANGFKESLQVLTQEEIESGKDRWVETKEDEKVWNSLSDEDKELLVLSNDMGAWFDEIQPNDDLLDRYYELRYKFSRFKNPDNKLKEDWAHFEFKDGSNSYIAKTEKEKQRILKKYGDKVKEIKKGFYIIEDNSPIKESRKLSSPYSSFKNYRKGFRNRTLRGAFTRNWDDPEVRRLGRIEKDAYDSEAENIQSQAGEDGLKLSKIASERELAHRKDRNKYYDNNFGNLSDEEIAKFSGKELAATHLKWSADDYNREHNLKESFEDNVEELKVDDFVRIKKGNDIKDDITHNYVGKFAYIDEIVEDENSAKISICDTETQLWIPLDCLEKSDESGYEYVEDDFTVEEEIWVKDLDGQIIDKLNEKDDFLFFHQLEDKEIIEELIDRYGEEIVIEKVHFNQDNLPEECETLYDFDDDLEPVAALDWEYLDPQDDDLDEKLIQGKSDATLKKNIKTEIEAGKDPKQAYAIAKSIQDKHLKESIEDESNEIEIDRLYHDASEDELRKMGVFDNYNDDFDEEVIEYSKVAEDNFDNTFGDEIEDKFEDELSDEEVKELEQYSENVAKLLNNKSTLNEETIKAELKVELNDNATEEEEEVVDYVNPNISDKPQEEKEVSIEEVKGE